MSATPPTHAPDAGTSSVEDLRKRAPLIVFYDGDCPFCLGAASFLLARDRSGCFHQAPLQGRTASALRAVLGAERLPDDLSSVILLDWSAEEPRIHLRSAALFRIMQVMGGPWRLLSVLRFLPRWLTDAVYDGVAAVRLRLAPARDTCPVGPAAQRLRQLP